MRRAVFFPLLICFYVTSAPAATLEYERDIMPIMEEKCSDCHSAGSGKVKGGLQLDDPEHFLKRFEKNEVVVPGNWDASYLFVSITRKPHAKGAMPPKGKGTPLTPDEIMKVANWIYQGAKVGREKGERGPKGEDPAGLLRFKDGALVTESFDDEPAATPEVKRVPREWENVDGKKMMATFEGVEGEDAVLIREDGRKFKYPIGKLSEASRALLEELTGE